MAIDVLRRSGLRFAAVLLAAIVAAPVAPIAVADETIPFSEYVRVLEQARDAAPEDSTALRRLKGLAAVEIPNVGVHRVDFSWARPGDRNLRNQLQIALDEALTGAWVVPIRTGRAEFVARQITERDEFKPKNSLVKQIAEAIGKFFDDLLNRRDTRNPADVDLPGEGPSSVFQILAFLLLAAAIVVVALLIWRRVRRREKEEDAEIGDDEEVWGIGPANPETLDSMASSAAAEGRYSDAVRALYLANLLRLDRRSVIRFSPALTNGAFRRSLARSFGNTVPAFDVATSIFERVHYGGETAGLTDWESSENAWNDVWQRVAV